MTQPKPPQPAPRFAPSDASRTPASPRPRIALFGGSFDPPHRGHLAIARAAAETFAIGRVFFAPTARQPLKPAGAQAPFPDRLAMVTLACAPDPNAAPEAPLFHPSDLDAPRPDHRPNYTVHTLATLAQQNPEAELFAIAGADSFLDLPLWRRAPELFHLAQWIVVSRPNFPLNALAPLNLTPHQRARTHLLETVHNPISATDLRHRLATGDPCTDDLPQAVAAYIQQHHLYLQRPPAPSHQPQSRS